MGTTRSAEATIAIGESTHKSRAEQDAEVLEQYRGLVDQTKGLLQPSAQQLIKDIFYAGQTEAIENIRESLTTMTAETFLRDALQTRIAEVRGLQAEYQDGAMTAQLPGGVLFAGVRPPESFIFQKIVDEAQTILVHHELNLQQGTYDLLQSGVNKASGTMELDERISIADEAAFLESLERAAKEQIIGTAINAVLGQNQEGNLPVDLQNSARELLDQLVTAKSAGNVLENNVRIQELWDELKQHVREVLFEKRTEFLSVDGSPIAREAAQQIEWNNLTSTKQHAAERAFARERDSELDTFSKISRWFVRGAGWIMLANLFLAVGCGGQGGGDGSSTPIPTGIDDDHHETPTIIPGGSTPEATLTPVPQILDGSLVIDVGSFPGAPPGVGGPDGGTATPYTESMRSLINTQGFGVVYAPNELGGPGQNLISVENNQICFAPIPDHLFAPYLGPEEQIFPLFEKQTAWGVVPFGTRDGIIHEQVITSFKIPDQFPADQYNCLMGYALEDNPYHIAAGSLTALIIDENGNVAAWADIGYDADAKISHQSDVTPVVDGKALKWEILPSAVVTPSETPTLHPEGQLFPTSWEHRYQLEFSDSLSNPEVYDQLSQILADNAAQILADDSHGNGKCVSLPSAPENNQELLPSRYPITLTSANIGAVYEIQQPEGMSYIVTISCKGPGEAEVLPKAVNLLFSWDMPDVENIVKSIINSHNTPEVEDMIVLIWGSASFDIPTRSDSQNVANTAYAKGFMPIFGRFIDGNLVQDPAFPETTDAGAIESLSPNLVVVHSADIGY